VDLKCHQYLLKFLAIDSCVLVCAWRLNAQSSSWSSWINFCGGCVRSSFFALESLVCLSLFEEK
jgi:hypothetical protein